jgi:hypothetical protein
MSKPYREEDLSNQLDLDIAWRLKEFSDLKASIRAAPIGSRSVLLRALVALLYAHWEGHVRFCISKYFDYITMRRLPFDAVEHQMYVNAFLVRLDGIFSKRASISDRSALITEIVRSRGKRFSSIHSSLIDTKSNLNSDVLRDLCTICSIDFAVFESSSTFLDAVILKRRNSIAHGEEHYVAENEMDNLIDKIVSLMRAFKNQLENKVYTKSYLAAA